MKVRIKATGEIINVFRKEYTSGAVAYTDTDTPDCSPFHLLYQEDELDFLPEKESAVLEGWVCRDKDNSLMLFTAEKPERVQDYWDSWDKYYHEIPSPLFPSVTWKSEPQKVKITIEEI